MKILVMGSGGVGGYFGGRLAGSGNDVTFIARGAHLDVILRDGLQIISPLGNLTVKPAKAVADPAEASQPEIVVFATKLGDTGRAARSMRPVVRDAVLERDDGRSLTLPSGSPNSMRADGVLCSI